MNLLFGDWIIKVIGKVSKSDLERMVTRNVPIIAVGEESYWEEISLLFVNSTNGDAKFWIAIYSENNINPYIVCHIDRDRLVIGFNQKLVIIDLNVHKILIEKELYGNFQFAKYVENMLFILSEIGIFILDNENHEIFNQPTDVIESFIFSGNLLIFKTHSGTHTIDISTVVRDH